jgi:hypothetical protein
VIRIAAAAWLAAIAVALATGALGVGETLVDEGPGCALRAITGVPCPLCGMTHATVALGAGDLAGAVAAHPLAPLVLAGIVALCAAVVRGGGERVLRRWPAWVAGLAVVWLARLWAP